MAKVHTMSRAAIMVRDLGRAEAFYREVIGFTEVFFAGKIGPPNQAPINRLLGMPENANTRATMLKAPGPAVGMVAMFEVKDPAPEEGLVQKPYIRLGEVCLVFNCNGLDEIMARVKAAGCMIFCEPVPLEVGTGTQRETIFRDPDGTLINLMEMSPERYRATYPDGELGTWIGRARQGSWSGAGVLAGVTVGVGEFLRRNFASLRTRRWALGMARRPKGSSS